MYLFNGPKYITRGIQDEIGLDIQQLIWKMIESKRKLTVLDYLQIFNLCTIPQENGIRQLIIHRQEEPPFNYQIFFNVSKPVNAKIYVIDDIEHVTMLLANEY